MTKSVEKSNWLDSIEEPETGKVKTGRWSWVRYTVSGVGANALLWGVVVTYLKVAPPSYICEWSLILPETGVKSNVSINNIGQASSSSDSPYSSLSLDPRANYQAILESDPVLEAAAQKLGIEVKDLGEPKIKLVPQTAVMNISVSAKSAEGSTKKSLALYEAFQQRLAELRAEEARQRQQGVRDTIERARDKLQKAQQELLAYQSRTGLASIDQFREISLNIEQLRKQQIEVQAEQEQLNRKQAQMSASLGLTPQQAADALVLQADTVFQQYLKNYAESSALLKAYLSKWSPTHPGVVDEQAKQEAARQALMQRIRLLVGRELSEQELQPLMLSDVSNKRADLFQELISVRAQLEGLTGQAEELGRKIAQLESKQPQKIEEAAKLEDLQSQLQAAETVFRSTMAQQDVGKSDIYAAYPLVQLLKKPVPPEKPNNLKTLLVLAGASLGTLFVTAGLILLWMRERRYHQEISQKN
ncbi:GumC family protein [Kamptonema formosum]|uniref:GumC family protein n=1 Tax=Kamptonema formosum TaxID=331992 RepID=UPI00037AC926|nr:hypothetical protein [Oscillatoria sp. PCC 10802]